MCLRNRRSQTEFESAGTLYIKELELSCEDVHAPSFKTISLALLSFGLGFVVSVTGFDSRFTIVLKTIMSSKVYVGSVPRFVLYFSHNRLLAFGTDERL
jgi:hypothetical protein